MTSPSKFKAKNVFWDNRRKVVRSQESLSEYRFNDKLKLPTNIIRFDSQHEFKVYLELIRLYGERRVKLQYPIKILPEGYCYPNGKFWKVDFAITSDRHSSDIYLYVEAKGMVLPEFCSVLAALEARSKYAFNKLRIVFPQEPPKRNKVIASLSKTPFAPNLLSLQTLKRRAY